MRGLATPPQGAIFLARDEHTNIYDSLMTGLTEGVRSHGRRSICWIDNIIAWTGQSESSLLTRDRGRWSALTHPHSQPSRSDDGEMT